MEADIALTATGIILLGILCQWLAWSVRLPAILFLLVAGILVGPITGLVNPDALFGDLMFPFVSLAVAIILFEGSLTLKFSELKGLGKVVRNLITVGALITWIITAIAAHYLIGFSWEISALFGAIVIVTGPTVIIPMLRVVRPNQKISNILRWEGITIDPLGALCAVIAYEFIISGQNLQAFDSIAFIFTEILLVGFIAGALAAGFLWLSFTRSLVPEYLRIVLTLAIVLISFSASNYVAHESGLLTVTVMGMILANLKGIETKDILHFKETLSVLLISVLFIVLAARIEIYQIVEILPQATLVLLVMIFIARPLSVLVSSINSDLNLKEKMMIAWIGPRGIVAAAIAALFALKLEKSGYPDAVYIVPLTFMIIIGTVVIQSATATLIAKLLNVREPSRHGFLILGAGIVSRTIAKALQENNIKVLLTDSSWENVREARMAGLNVYYGTALSDHADRHIDLSGIGKLLAMSGRGNLDSLASMHFKSDFGAENVYSLKTSREQQLSDEHLIPEKLKGRQLFAAEITYGLLADWIRLGAEIKRTNISEEFTFADYQERYQEAAQPLFAFDDKQKLHIFTANLVPDVKAGWSIIAIIKES